MRLLACGGLRLNAPGGNGLYAFETLLSHACGKVGTITGRSQRRISVLEREPQLQTLLEAEWPAAQVSIRGFAKPGECLERIATEPCDVLILDLEGGTQDKLALLDRVKRIAPSTPCLVVVERGAVATAVAAIRAGACDCLEKPVPSDRLMAAVRTQLTEHGASTHHRPATLTPTETYILELVLAGATSQEIASDLHRSVQTVNVHRKNIKRKLHATSTADVIKWALTMHLDTRQEAAPAPGRA